MHTLEKYFFSNFFQSNFPPINCQFYIEMYRNVYTFKLLFKQFMHIFSIFADIFTLHFFLTNFFSLLLC